MKYIPGLIWLCVVPFAFIQKARKVSLPQPLHAISLLSFDSSSIKRFYPNCRTCGAEVFPKRNYINLNITGNTAEDAIMLEFAQIKVREILTSGDDQNGIHFHFAENSNYGSFVRVLDILRTEAARKYAHIDNDIWFLNDSNYKRPVKIENDSKTDLSEGYVFHEYPGLSKWEIFKQHGWLYWQNG